MKIRNTAMIALSLCLITGLLALSCSSDDGSATENHVTSVQRGNLSLDITASGNLALSVMEDLPFALAGIVDEVLVKAGESVEEGQLLATLDSSQWEEELLTLQRQLTQAERQVTTKERDLLQAEINLKNADQNLEDAQKGTTTTLTGDIKITTTDPLEIEMLELQVELYQGRLEDAELAVSDAENDVQDAKDALSDAQSASLEVTAPFAGFITKVNVQGGDEVKKGTVAVVIADPDQFEVDVMVSEMDINQLTVGGVATVQPTAFTTMGLPAVISHISPTATIQQGVVNYQVTVELQSLATFMPQMPMGSQDLPQAPDDSQDLPQGKFPEGFTEGPEGLFTEEQLEEMRQRREEGGQSRGWLGMQTAGTAETMQLKEGMTVTVSIIISQQTDVLLIPNGAITTRGGQSYVQVVLEDDTIEERAVTIGINDWQYTEVTDGLSEGEQIIVPQGSTASTTTTQQGRPGQMMPVGPGFGGVFR